jgi:hypothetical protein
MSTKIENYKNEERRVGIELEYSGINACNSAKIINDLFGGNIAKKNNITYFVEETSLGDFKVELDAILLQEAAQRIKDDEREKSDNIFDKINIKFDQSISKIGERIVPFEIVAPPISIKKLDKLEELCDALYKKGTKGTGENFYYAFGMHINPEVCSLAPEYILKHIQSFLLLTPWLIKQHKIDLTRRITSFIDPFTKPYLNLVLRKSYNPDLATLIKDYHYYNPTRNRALDMTPLFAFIDEDLTRSLYGNKEKINKRPTFHYRLPNCDIGNKEWSIINQWEIWLKVEELASNEKKLGDLIEKWQQHNNKLIFLESDWLKVLSKANYSN